MEDDYDLEKLEEIEVRNLRYFIMPRYRHHYLSNDYEDFSLDIMLANLNSDSTFVDIGSHYGIYSLLAARKVQKGSVIAIEPVPENYKILNKNINANKLTNIQSHNYAASDKAGEAEFNIPWASDSAGFYEHPNAETIRRVPVKMINPDALIKNKKVDFIKIDTEGHELHVIDGLTKTLEANPQAKMLIELNPQCLLNAGAKPIDLLLRLKALNKAILLVDEENRKLINITDDPTKWDEYITANGYANIYCVPIKDFSYVLFVSPSASLGGAELALFELEEDLKEKGLMSHFAVPSEGGLTKLLKEQGIGYTVIPFGSWAHRKKLSDKEREDNDAWNAKAVQDISELTQQINPDLIFSNTIICPWGGIVASATKTPHIWMIHEYGNLDHNLLFEYGYDETLRMIDRLSDEIIVNSTDVKKHLSKIIDAKKIKQIYLRFKLEEIESKAKQKTNRMFDKKDALKLILVGRISETKGQLVAVKALKALNDQNVKAQLLIVGDVESESYMRQIRKVISRDKLTDMVKIIGYVNNPMPYVSQADIALMCSRKEAFGRVTVEAMLLGKPVVGTNSGSTKLLIEDGSTGLLFEPDNDEDLAKNLILLAKNKKNINVMGAKAKKYAQDTFTSDKYVDLVDGLIKQQKRNSISGLGHPVYMYDMFINESKVLNRQLEDAKQANRALQQSLDEAERQRAEIHRTIEYIHRSKSWKLARALSEGKYRITKISKRQR
jgi:FkbM family methyltransferase